MKFKKLLLVMPAFLIAGTLVGCGESSSTSTNVLAVSNLESSYYVGDKLDTSKIKVTSVASDGKETEVDPANLEYSKTDAFTSTGKQVITVKDKTNNAKGAFTVNVLNDYEVDEERYSLAVYNFLHANVKIDVTYKEIVKSGEEEPVTKKEDKYVYKRNGKQESLKENDEKEQFRYYNLDAYYDVASCYKGENKTFAYVSSDSDSLFDDLNSNTDIQLSTLWYFDYFTLNSNNVYKLEYSTTESGANVSMNYALTFNKGQLKQVDYSLKYSIDSESYKYSEEHATSYTMDYSFGETLFTEPEELDFLMYQIDYSNLEKVGTNGIVNITNFVRYNESGNKESAYDSLFITEHNVAIDEVNYYDSSAGEYVDVTEKVELTAEVIKDEQAKEATIKCTFDLSKLDPGHSYTIKFNFLGATRNKYITL